MPYLRLTADRRGVEHTFLLHVAAPGEKPRVLYWYRTVPGVRIGRPALDDAAMRALEEQYPDIDFDWPYILEVGTMTPVEVEAPVPPRKRKPLRRVDDDVDASEGVASAAAPVSAPGASPSAPVPSAHDDAAVTTSDGPDLLSELLGRGIAASLRDRVADLATAIAAASADPARQAGWRARLARLDPDQWQTAEAVLAGMSTVDRELEALTDELDASSADPA